jgi:hypothetical protein
MAKRTVKYGMIILLFTVLLMSQTLAMEPNSDNKETNVLNQTDEGINEKLDIFRGIIKRLDISLFSKDKLLLWIEHTIQKKEFVQLSYDQRDESMFKKLMPELVGLIEKLKTENDILYNGYNDVWKHERDTFREHITHMNLSLEEKIILLKYTFTTWIKTSVSDEKLSLDELSQLQKNLLDQVYEANYKLLHVYDRVKVRNEKQYEWKYGQVVLLDNIHNQNSFVRVDGERESSRWVFMKTILPIKIPTNENISRSKKYFYSKVTKHVYENFYDDILPYAKPLLYIDLPHYFDIKCTDGTKAILYLAQITEIYVKKNNTETEVHLNFLYHRTFIIYSMILFSNNGPFKQKLKNVN